jgi:poly(A) polymerase
MTDTPPPSGSPRPPSRREDAEAVVRRLRDAGHVAYFAGGCVRDELLGLTPKDYDVATDAPPPRVRELFKNTQAVGAAFGVILVRWKQSQIEVATFRAEGAYVDGRRPSEVTFTTAEQDAQRRDFTINGLFYDPIDRKVIDYVGGQNDLRAKVLRAIGEPNHRFDEDHLRLLRAIRFAARFSLTIEPNTAAAIRRHAEQLKRISPERIAEELRLMLTPATRLVAWRLLQDFGLDDVIFRFVALPWPARHSDAAGDRKSISIFERVRAGESVTFALALTTVVVDHVLHRLPHLGDWPRLRDQLLIRQIVRALRQGLRISNEEADAVEGALYGLAQLLQDQPPPRVATFKRFLTRPTAQASRELLTALAATVLPPARATEVERRLTELERTDFAPAPFITGDDLIAQGLQPGKLFKRLLDEVYDAQLEDRLTTREQALELAITLAKAPPRDE